MDNALSSALETPDYSTGDHSILEDPSLVNCHYFFFPKGQDFRQSCWKAWTNFCFWQTQHHVNKTLTANKK